tara:strand:+ start:83 stop:232 length:150 start_codon:yes stop_codon:yes gene_type:complete
MMNKKSMKDMKKEKPKAMAKGGMAKGKPMYMAKGGAVKAKPKAAKKKAK